MKIQELHSDPQDSPITAGNIGHDKSKTPLGQPVPEQQQPKKVAPPTGDNVITPDTIERPARRS